MTGEKWTAVVVSVVMTILCGKNGGVKINECGGDD